MGIIDSIKKRLTVTSTSNRRKFSLFKGTPERVYNNHTTWREIYQKEPFVRGAVDSKVNAIVGEWDLDVMTEKPTKVELELVKRIKSELRDPEVYLETKLRTLAYRLILDTVAYVECSTGDMNFYILNPEHCQITWAEGDKFLDGIKWSKTSEFETVGKFVHLKGKEFAFASLFDPDTNLFKSSPMEANIEIANLLAYSRRYNLEIFDKGGIPAMLYNLPVDTTDEEFERFDKMVGRAKPGSNLISKGDVKATPIAGFTKDMEYDKLVNHGVQSVMTSLQVNPQMMSMGGVQSPSGGESARQEMNAFGTGVHSVQRIINEIMTMVIRNLYDDSSDEVLPRRGRKRSGIKNIRFKMRKWVDVRQQSAIHKIYSDIQVMTPNEIRAEIGREPVEWGDEPINGVNVGNAGGENPVGQPERGEENEYGENDDVESDSASGETSSQEAEKR